MAESFENPYMETIDESMRISARQAAKQAYHGIPRARALRRQATEDGIEVIRISESEVRQAAEVYQRFYDFDEGEA